MKLPEIHGVIQRRILLNYRVDPDLLAALLPPPFRPDVVRGYGVMGVCMIRLAELRPKYWPAPWGFVSENAALRAAVEWEQSDALRRGVFISRRDTNSRINALAGGRLFAGVHRYAQFRVEETADRFDIQIKSRDGGMDLALQAHLATEFPRTSVFETIATAARFFEHGSVGYSQTHQAGRFDGLELKCDDWPLAPLAVERAESSYFDDARRFPPGSIELDSALLMRNVHHTWRGLDDLCCDAQLIRQPVPQAAGL